MSEVIVENDLEEGEITDDSLPEVFEIVSSFEAKPKKLPRRYALRGKFSNIKHKRNCRQRKSKCKSDSFLNSSDSNKQHKSSCQWHSFERPSFSNGQVNRKQFNTKRKRQYDNNSLSLNSKNCAKPSTFAQKSVNPPNSNSDSYRKLLQEYKKSQKQLSHERKQSDSSAKDVHLKPKDDSKGTFSPKKVEETSLPHFNSHKCVEEYNLVSIESYKCNERINSSNKSQKSFGESSFIHTKENSPEEIVDEVTLDESEDEEELRRIALATCSKRIPLQLTTPLISPEVCNLSNSPSLSPSNQSTIVYCTDNENKYSDNYDVVDMDIDPESGVENDDLYVIDTTPTMSSDLTFDKNQEPDQNHQGDSFRNSDSLSLQNNNPFANSQTNGNFEDLILRAELIAGMKSRQKSLNAKGKGPVAIASPGTDVKIVEPIERAKTPPKTVLGFKNISVKKNEVLKLSNAKSFKALKTSVTSSRSINSNQERIVITLNNDTTSDESDDEEDKNGTPDNVAVSNIEALITDARQKSDIQANSVSCLSKAQQEEYSLLKKVLAEKDPMFPQPVVEEKKLPAKNANLNFLRKKISMSKVNLTKELEGMTNAGKELLKKKQMYITSKLKVQHLNEQLHAAEQVRSTNLESWKMSAAKLGIIKKSVLKRKALISLLETQLNNKQLQNEQNLSPTSQ